MNPFFRRGAFGALFFLSVVFSGTAFATGRPYFFFPETVEVGQPFLVEITATEEPKGATATWFGTSVPFHFTPSGDGFYARLLLGTYVKTVRPGKYPLEISLATNDRIDTKQVLISIIHRQYEEDRLTLPDAMVSPPKTVLKRILKEQRMVQRVRETVSPYGFWDLPMTRPVSGSTSSTYGRRRILNGIPKSPHAGIDFRAPAGTPVLAALSGRVVLTGNLYFSGTSVCIDSGQGVVTYYYHLSEIFVREGQKVEKGAVIGKSGMSGRATGPHLHFGLSLLGHYVDAEALFSATPRDFLGKTKMLSLTN